MQKNVGQTDKIIRYLLALIFLYLGYVSSAWFYILAILLAVTAATGTCWIYKLFGIDTSKNK